MALMPIAGTRPVAETAPLNETSAPSPARSVSDPSEAAGFDTALGAAEFRKALRPLVRHEAEKVAPEEQFEAFALRNFVESMLPSEADNFFGSGTAGSIWRSMLAEHLGAKLAEDGGIGIARSIAEKTGRAGPEEARQLGAGRTAPFSQTLAALSLKTGHQE